MKVGLIAHDAKKRSMQDLCIAYKRVLARNQIYATNTTGNLIEEVTDLKIHKFLPGHLGGMEQMASLIANNEIDMIIFLRNPDSPTSHEPDVNDVVKLCDKYNIPIATNLATAELLILALLHGELEWREI